MPAFGTIPNGRLTSNFEEDAKSSALPHGAGVFTQFGTFLYPEQYSHQLTERPVLWETLNPLVSHHRRCRAGGPVV
jgi:hypothetical protein